MSWRFGGWSIIVVRAIGSGTPLTNKIPKRSCSYSSTLLSSPDSVKVCKGDITRWSPVRDTSTCTAIVNATSPNMLQGGTIHNAIHSAAGPALRQACLDKPLIRHGVRCPIGEARVTLSGNLPVSYVIHTAVPLESEPGSINLLRQTYRSCLRVARYYKIRRIAFPPVGCGNAGFPSSAAACIALSTVKEFRDDFKEVHFIVSKDSSYTFWSDQAKILLPVDDSEIQAKSVWGFSAGVLLDTQRRLLEAFRRLDEENISDMLKLEEEVAKLEKLVCRNPNLFGA